MACYRGPLIWGLLYWACCAGRLFEGWPAAGRARIKDRPSIRGCLLSGRPPEQPRPLKDPPKIRPPSIAPGGRLHIRLHESVREEVMGMARIPDTIECPRDNWEPVYDAEGEIIGRICLTCGAVEGRLS